MIVFFTNRQVEGAPEWNHLSETELGHLMNALNLKLLRDGVTLLGHFTLAILLFLSGYWAIVEVHAEPLSTILTILVGGLLGFVACQWHIHRARKWLRDHPADRVVSDFRINPRVLLRMLTIDDVLP